MSMAADPQRRTPRTTFFTRANASRLFCGAVCRSWWKSSGDQGLFQLGCFADVANLVRQILGKRRSFCRSAAVPVPAEAESAGATTAPASGSPSSSKPMLTAQNGWAVHEVGRAIQRITEPAERFPFTAALFGDQTQRGRGGRQARDDQRLALQIELGDQVAARLLGRCRAAAVTAQ